ncbi:MAG: hypothetical protein RR839_00590 [Oscillospiraceae bacterium]
MCNENKERLILAEKKNEEGVAVTIKGTNKDLMHIYGAICSALLNSGMSKGLLVMLAIEAEKQEEE